MLSAQSALRRLGRAELGTADFTGRGRVDGASDAACTQHRLTHLARRRVLKVLAPYTVATRTATARRCATAKCVNLDNRVCACSQ